MKTYNMQIEMNGLIQILAENLYADPNVFVRELIQNAHDAIIKRGVDQPDFVFKPEIRVMLDQSARTLSFLDNGAGLTQDEIHRYLSTIGGSDKRSFSLQSRNFSGQDHQNIKEMIGQFGIGLLSSFIVSDKIEILTRSANEKAFLWRNDGCAEYQLEEAQRDHVGTTVTLYLKAAHQRYLDLSYLSTNICRYADFIGIPIFMNHAQEAVNCVHAPWHFDGDLGQHADFWNNRFPNETILALMPLDLPCECDEGEKRYGQVRGTLAITTHFVPDVQAQGVVDLFISGMFIATNMRAILPSWASFVHGVIETALLTPNAARDNIMPTPMLPAVQAVLGQKILTWLRSLAKDKPATFKEIMHHHAMNILSMSLQAGNQALLQEMMALMPLLSNFGHITLDEYIKYAQFDSHGIKTIYYFTDAASGSQQFMLADTEKRQVIDASVGLVREFLQQYVVYQQGAVRLQKTNTNMQQQLQVLSVSDAQHCQHLKTVCDRLFPVNTVIANFEPEDIPFLMLENEKSVSLTELEALNDSPVLSQHMREMMSVVLAEKVEVVKLYMNVNNALIQKLSTLIHTSPHVSEQALSLLYNNALMLYARRVKPSQVKTVFRQANYTVDLLLDASVLLQQQQEHIQVLEAEVAQLSGMASPYQSKQLM